MPQIIIVYYWNYLRCQVDSVTLGVKMETKRSEANQLPMYNNGCNFKGYDPATLMLETAKLRKLITKRGTLEMLVPLCCTSEAVRHKEFRMLLKGFSSKTLANPIFLWTTGRTFTSTGYKVEYIFQRNISP